MAKQIIPACVVVWKLVAVTMPEQFHKSAGGCLAFTPRRRVVSAFYCALSERAPVVPSCKCSMLRRSIA
jgi:hypothetical protein